MNAGIDAIYRLLGFLLKAIPTSSIGEQSKSIPMYESFGFEGEVTFVCGRCKSIIGHIGKSICSCDAKVYVQRSVARVKDTMFVKCPICRVRLNNKSVGMYVQRSFK